MGDSCGLSGSEALSDVLVVSDVLDSHFSAVSVLSELPLSDFDLEIVEPQSFSPESVKSFGSARKVRVSQQSAMR